jgi:signal transduction histidine kinase
METLLMIALVISMLAVFILSLRLLNIKKQLLKIKNMLAEIKSGNLNRRILTDKHDVTSEICYDINEIAIENQSQLIRQKQSEQAYKRLMTSLSHDVKTPLASLIGYLEAIESEIVEGEEKKEYTRIALSKAYSLKNFVHSLFEWVQLDAGEQIIHFTNCDINELSRDILTDWITILENSHFEYDINIPDSECLIRLDINSYTRIINNLLQNIITHSEGNHFTFCLTESENQVEIIVADNGKGISEHDLPHIFERMYTCDYSRSTRGSGLGLAIVKELVNIHKGKVRAESIQGAGVTFYISLPKAA